jgi:hypothetical protein
VLLTKGHSGLTPFPMHILKKCGIVIAAAVAVGVFALAARIGVLSFRENSIMRQYKAHGFQILEGCNGGAAVQAAGQVLTIKQYLEDFADSPTTDTNLIIQLQTALVIAEEKAKVLSDDCCRRGHRDSYPWKSNWATIKQALAAAEKQKQ